MSLKIVKKISLIFLIYFIFGISNAEENLKRLGKFKDWESFVLLQGESKVCFAQSIPVIRAPIMAEVKNFCISQNFIAI